MGDWSEEKQYLARKGLSDQREHVRALKLKPVLLEYFVEEHGDSYRWFSPAPGWNKHGSYKTRAQALRVIEDVRIRIERGARVYGPTPGCKWRIDGVEVEGL